MNIKMEVKFSECLLSSIKVIRKNNWFQMLLVRRPTAAPKTEMNIKMEVKFSECLLSSIKVIRKNN